MPVSAQGFYMANTPYRSILKGILYCKDSAGTYTTHQTPKATAANLPQAAAAEEIEPIRVNAKGEAYGPDLLRNLLGYSPDLAPAVNDDGFVGYVRCVKEIPVSAEEMKILSAASDPLYDQDGNVIGIFELDTEMPVQVIGKTVSQVQEDCDRAAK